MKTKQLVTKIKKAYEADCGCKMEEYGPRIKFVAEGRVELGCTYFYTSQARMRPEVLVTYAKEAGVEIALRPLGEMEFKTMAWPKTSWATQLYEVVIK